MAQDERGLVDGMPQTTVGDTLQTLLSVNTWMTDLELLPWRAACCIDTRTLGSCLGILELMFGKTMEDNSVL